MSQERRQFYRVEKDVALEVQQISANEANHSLQPTQFEVSPYFELLCEVQELDQLQTTLLQQISESHPLFSQLFELQSEKLNVITRTLASSGLKIEKLTKQSINLSEGGMQFTASDECYQIGDFLAIKLIFSNPIMGVLLYGKVQRVIQGQEATHIAVTFHQIPENCRMLIAQRVIQPQPSRIPEIN